MTFELESSAAVRRDAAREMAHTVGAASAARLDAGQALAGEVRQALRAVLPARPEDARLDWVIGIEELAVVSPAMALAAVADALALPALTTPSPWPGCRGVDLEAARELDSEVWHLAVTAVCVGGGRAAVESAVEALRSATAAGRPNPAAQPGVADAATAVDGSRLLLWDAASQSAGHSPQAARYLARVHGLDSVALALRALGSAVGMDACRAGTPLERLRRDLDTLVLVLGGERASLDAAAQALSAN